ncbi:hypothetical protein KXD40_002079 [Peronospora effusa]|uniref:Uncharacterized protein n=1 Tax=Peronospora effusa TaxID=542832 RepID=A0A3M6VHD1_9STRA|nr:hypothetical protein DD238_002107 [Peronospora effusa]RQM18216.1 hypothetical protein DD237_000112 [Peronospora effusa]UIZ26803.1 hypothetical protein KXD40_002079 [Peronospora effusa]CAI5725631.1 unnamed protein product [Peronospora effusa]
MAISTDRIASEHQHRPIGDCPHAVASTIIQRHRDNRQRFDSADYEMARRVPELCAGCSCGKRASSDTIDPEHEPEPEFAEYRDEIRCLRMQRFDSADWAVQTQRAKQTDSSSSELVNVAQMLMDRHVLKRLD